MSWHTTDVGSLQLVAYALGSLYVGIAFHELGHVVAGRLAGFRIAAFGIGHARPFFCTRIFGTRFYLARRNPLDGLTLALFDRLLPSRNAMLLLVAGGPMANLLLFALAGLAWSLGVRQPWLAVLSFASLALFFVSVAPFEVLARSGLSLGSDGLQILRLLRGTRWNRTSPGSALGSVRTVRDLCRGVGAKEAAAVNSLILALQQAALGDAAAARATLDGPELEAIDATPPQARLAALVHAAILMSTNPAEADTAIHQALDVCRDDPTAFAIASQMRAQAAIDAGRPAAEFAQAALAAAHASGHPHLVTTSRILQREADPTDTFARDADELLALGGAAAATPTMRLRLLSAAARITAERGDVERARGYFARAASWLGDLAAEIPDETTRRRFVAHSSAPLRQAARCDAGDTPLFLNPDPRPRQAVSHAAPIVWASIALVLLLVDMARIIWGEHPLDPQSLPPAGLAAGAAAGGVFSALVRRRHVPRAVMVRNGLLTFLVLLACMGQSAFSRLLTRDEVEEDEAAGHAAAATASAPAEDMVLFGVTVPSSTPPDATVYLSGNIDALGNGRSDGLGLTRGSGGAYHATVTVPHGSEIEFTVTLGSFDKREQEIGGKDVPPRRLTVRGNTFVHFEVGAWASAAAGEPSMTPASKPHE